MSYFRIPIHFSSMTSNSKFLLTTRLSFLKNQWVKGLFGFLVVLGMISQLSNHLGLVYSHTNSLPYHLFLHFKQLEPRRGHYTCFNSPWYGRRVIKKVAGMGGDVLIYDKKGNLWVKTVAANSSWLGRPFKVGKHKKYSKDGCLLTPIKPGIIPKGMVFVSGEHERSFDSRYEELGLVSVKDLQGRLIALV